VNVFDHLSRWAASATRRLAQHDRTLDEHGAHLGRLDHGLDSVLAEVTARLNVVDGRLDAIESTIAAWADDLGILRAFLDSLTAPTTYRVVIDAEWSTTAMGFQIADDDTSKRATIEVDDALGLALDPGSVTVVAEYSSSDTSVATVDPVSGAITPASPPVRGTFQVQAVVTDSASGTVLTGTPAECEIIPGPAATFKVVVG